MSIVKWSPMKELEEMRKDMERFFGDIFEPFPRRRRWWLRPTEPGVVVPNIDMYDKKDEIVVKAELPGVEKDNVELTISKDSLTIKGETKKEQEIKEEDYYCSERSYGSFLRTIALPVGIDADKAKATFKNGVIEIRLPKIEEVKPKEIKVQVE